MEEIENIEERVKFLGLKDSFIRLSRHSFIYGLGSVLTGIFSFLLIPLYTRFLTTEDYGIIAFLAALEAVLMAIFALQLDGATYRFCFEETGERRKMLIGSLWYFQALFSLALCALFFFLAGNIAAGVFKDMAMQPYLKLLAIRIFFNIGGLIPLGLLQAKERSFAYSSLAIFTAILGISLNIYFIVYLKRGALGMIQAGVITSGLLYMVYLCLIFKESILSLKREFIVSALAFSLPIIPHTLATWVLNLSDRILLERLGSLADVGLYSLGCNISLVLGVVIMAINRAWTPFFYSVAEKHERSPSITKLVTYYFAFIASFALILSVFSREITGFMAASAYRSAYVVIPVIALSFVIQGMYFLSANIIFLKKKTRYIPIATIAAAATNFTLNLLWIPRYGIMGAAWATAIAFSLLYLITFLISKRLYVIVYEKRRIAKIIISVCVVYAVSTGIKSSSPPVSAYLKALVMLAYLLILFLFRFFSREELCKIKSFLTAAR